ncbi:hypothetical protein [Roseovarius pelagicus]|uniref:Uncharacterized protein n=1 Tax=Roseovarius pelagicus TaxID=2980108 RepID=A0ABY6DFI4_9RHOB|nr:hypothetical protein [Roseovarius pelagicus]UXX84916.1 hypothetical protein N7U68_09850 [Roseovarius pelagicus]
MLLAGCPVYDAHCWQADAVPADPVIVASPTVVTAAPQAQSTARIKAGNH